MTTPPAAATEPATAARDGRARATANADDGATGAPKRFRLVVLNHYFVPDVASTGHLLAELVDGLAHTGGFDVSVVTCRPCYGPPESWQPAPSQERRDGVYIRRLQATRFNKDSLLGRALNYLSFIVPLTFRQLARSDKDAIYLYTTNPPFLGVIGVFVGLFRKHRYVMLLHDAYPQLAVWVGTFKRGGLIERAWHAVNKRIYRRAEHTIVLCKAAKRLVCDTYGVPDERVSVIPNWADGSELFPIAKDDSSFAEEHGLRQPFTLLYSGNLGLYYEFETLLGAAERLRDESFRLVFIGSGGKKAWIVEQKELRNLDNVLVLPYQPFERLNESLNSCDASLVTIAEGIEGISFPSKLYSSLAVGKAVVALSEPSSELRELVETEGIGVWAPLGDADGLAEQLRAYVRDRGLARDAGAKARALFAREYTLERAVERYGRVLKEAAEGVHRG